MPILKSAICTYLEDFSPSPENRKPTSPDETTSQTQSHRPPTLQPQVRFLEQLASLESSFAHFKLTVACDSLRRQLLEADLIYYRSTA